MIRRPRRDGLPGRLSKWQRWHLLTGHHYGSGFVDEAAAREAWAAHREALMAYWTRSDLTPEDESPEPGGPGTRPWAWWRFEAAAEPRRRLGGVGLGGADDPDAPAWRRKMSFGVPSVWSGVDWSDVPVYESEPAYLDRLGLLSDEERRAIEGKDWNRIGHSLEDMRLPIEDRAPREPGYHSRF